MQIRQTDVFLAWRNALRDDRARAKIRVRITRLANGNPGDVKPVGEGVSELRVNHGPGYRIYYTAIGDELVILLCGGDKSSQDKDIKTAKQMAKELKETGNGD